MDLLLTVPARLALMALDAHPDVTAASEWFTASLDALARPFWLVEPETATYAGASNLAQGTSTHTLRFFGMKIGTDADVNQQGEAQMRAIVDATVQYLLEHHYLNFSNKRGTLVAPLDSLSGVMFASIERGKPSLYGTTDDPSGAYWGCTITATVTEQRQAHQFVFPNMGA